MTGTAGVCPAFYTLLPQINQGRLLLIMLTCGMYGDHVMAVHKPYVGSSDMLVVAGFGAFSIGDDYTGTVWGP